MNFVIATSRHWNEHLAADLSKKTGHMFHLITTREGLSVQSLEGIKPTHVFFPHWSYIIPEEIFTRFSCVIFHMTDVPYGRGGSPLQNLIARGHTHTKMTALKCIKELDAGPVFLKRSLCLNGSAEEIFLRAADLVENMILEIVTANPNPQPQEGEPVHFTRRTEAQSDMASVSDLNKLYDHIRMLDAEGYPKAFLEMDGFRLEFSRASLRHGKIKADVTITPREKKMNIAVIAAHPDDEILGCGATMAKLAAQGAHIEVLIVAEGITSRSDARDVQQSMGELTELSEASQKANDCVGVSSYKQLSFPDNRLDSVDLLDLVKAVESFLGDTLWDRVYTHFSNDLNVDHRYVHEATVTACRPMPGENAPELLFFETQSSTEWRSPHSFTGFSPTVFEDVTQYLDKKIAALAEYECEMRPWPHARSIKAVEHLARWRGSTIGVEAAEAFQLGRIVR